MRAGLWSLSASDLTAGYANGEFTPDDVVVATLERARSAQLAYNAFVEILEARALRAAAESTGRWRRGEPLGPLDGVPFTVKENIAVAGRARTGGSRSGAGAPLEERDGPSLLRLSEAGAVPLGITVMPDWGMLSSGVSSLHGITRSPWNSSWTVGGSSGGAAAAATAGVGPLHLGSDIGGSLRLPATWTGLVTLKPTSGRVAVDPPYMGRVVGPLARTTADVVAAMSCIARPHPSDYTALPDAQVDWAAALGRSEDTPRGLTVGVHLTGGAGLATDPEVADIVAAAAEHFASAGARVSMIEPPMTPDLLEGLDLFLRARSYADFEALPPDRRDLVLPFIRDWVLGAAGRSGSDVIRAYAAVQELRRRTVDVTEPYDLVLSPVAPVAAFDAEWPMPSNDPATSLHHIAYTAPYNFSEQPAASINAGFTTDGRPIGLQIAGRRHADVEVLRATAWYESTRPLASAPVWPW